MPRRRPANAAKTTFLRDASHELRTPLAVIVWLAELLQGSGGVPPERFARSLAGIRRSAEELLRTTRRSWISPAWIEPDAHAGSEIHLPPTIREALENLQPLAERKQLGLRRDPPGAPAAILTNGQQVRQVIVNLVANAIKFTSQGQIVVRVHRQESWW